MTTSRKNAPTTRGRPFEAGNPGRPKGARHKVTRAIEDILDGDAEKLTRKAIQLALRGDTTALRLCMERLAPARKSRSVRLDLPRVVSPADASAAMTEIVAAVGSGEIDPDEAQVLAALIEAKRRSLETTDLAERLARLEQSIADWGRR